MKLLFISLLCCVLVETRAQQPRNPGNWTFSANLHTEWTRLGINTKHTTYDSAGFIIRCDTSKKVISIIQEDGDTTYLPYGILEFYTDDPYHYQKGVFYYKTMDLGDIEYWPGEMVRRRWPGEFEIVYSLQLKRRK